MLRAVPKPGREHCRCRQLLCCLVSLLLLAGAVGCDGQLPIHGSGQGQGPGHRSQVLALSPEEEEEAGREAYRKVLQEVRGRRLPDDAQEVRRVRQVVRGIIKASEIEPLQREINLNVRRFHFDWEVNVVRDRQAIAFCLPAGKMIV